jgi:hypothetical protein
MRTEIVGVNKVKEALEMSETTFVFAFKLFDED